jgi:SulP family sulfate permease
MPSTRYVRVELVAGLVTALALIPETISFSIVAGVDPSVGLLSSFTFSLVIAFAGGRPAMVSAAAGSMALVAAPLVHDHGVGYLAAATVLAGVLQLGLAQAGAAKLLAALPRGVAIGFVNGLAILIFLAQLKQVVSATVLVLVLIGVAIMTVLRIRSVRFPPSLMSTVVLTVAAIALSLGVPTVGDAGALPTGLPDFALPGVPHTLGALLTILPYALSLAVVGLVESLLTADLLDRITDTTTSRRREARGQGLANVVTGFFGGQPGCAMIGQSLLNVDTGGRGRLSTLAAGAWLLALVVVLHPLMEIMPLAALVATMVFVAFTTFDWKSVTPERWRRWPWEETVAMVVTTVVVVATENLAFGVLAGAATAGALFARRHRGRPGPRVTVTSAGDLHAVHGALFFASTGRLVDLFETLGDAPVTTIDLGRAELLDTTAALTLEELAARRRAEGHTVHITGLSPASAELAERVTEDDEG